MVLICLFLCRSVSLSLFFFPPSSSSGLATSQSCPLPCFSRSLCPLPMHRSSSPSLPLAIFLHLELSLFCLFSIPRPSVNPSVTPSLSYLSFSSGLSISPGLFPLPSSSPSSFVFPIPSASSSGLSISPLLLLLLRAILLCSRCSARRKYSLFTPPP